jgi:hypothetical protein
LGFFVDLDSFIHIIKYFLDKLLLTQFLKGLVGCPVAKTSMTQEKLIHQLGSMRNILVKTDHDSQPGFIDQFK